MQSPTTINNTHGTRCSRISKAAAAVGSITLGWLIVAAAQDMPNGTLAAAIRSSGHACARVIEKERSGEDSSVWHVRCNSGRFQVTMKDNAVPEVVKID